MKKINRKNLKKMIVNEMKRSLSEIVYSTPLGIQLSGASMSRGYGSRSGGASESGDISGTDIAIVGGVLGAGAAGAAGLFGGSTPDGNQVSRSQRLSRITGLNPEIVYAIEMKESSCCGPRAFAFNGHVFMRNLSDPQEISDAQAAGFSHSTQNFYGSDATDMYEEAYTINPEAAIKGGAWGLYQVLGETSFDDYGTVTAFENGFSSDPVGHSESAFVRWWSNAGSGLVNTANSGDTAAWVSRYYGREDSGYISDVEGYMNDYRREVGSEEDSAS